MHSTVNVTGERHHLIRNKGIGYLHREVFKSSSYLQCVSTILLRQHTVRHQHLLIVITEISI